MSIGTSGRIVIEIDPSLKRQLYAELDKEGVTLKDWFLKNVDTYLNERHQLSLKFIEPISQQRVG